MKLVEWFLKTNAKQLQEAALAYEQSKRASAISVQEAHRAVLQQLAGQRSVLMGALLESGEDVLVGTEIADRHSVIVGATGSGKTRAIIDRLLRRIDLGITGDFDFELIDPKTETFTEMKKHLAACWLAADDQAREHTRRRSTSSTGRVTASRPRLPSTTATPR